MNTVLHYLTQNWQRLALESLADSARLSCVLATPRFRASSHVIFFVLGQEGSAPVLVAKVPRLPGDHARLDREASNLRLAYAARANGFDSIPRVIAYEEYHGHKLLIETALRGAPMKPALVQRRPKQCVEAGLAWLLDFHSATTHASAEARDWFATLIENPIRDFQNLLPPMAEELGWLEEILALAEPLRGQALPLVLSHEDLSHPNILFSAEGRAHVVDWELAEPNGLPGVDLFFFLTYIAFARRGAAKNPEYLAAFQEAFFGPQAWAKDYVARYAEHVRLPAITLTPLFLLCWTRYLIGLVARLSDQRETHAGLDHETLKWLRGNRYYALWRYALAQRRELFW
ncbi:MAG: aminoglycoside phosphotransferase family protein [candidate division KSB1 bacterium]